mgnify:CR=1 FL=1
MQDAMRVCDYEKVYSVISIMVQFLSASPYAVEKRSPKGPPLSFRLVGSASAWYKLADDVLLEHFLAPLRMELKVT